MSNNKKHNANYSLKPTFGKCPLGFKQTSGNTNTLAHRASKLIITPLPYNTKWNAMVNRAVASKDEVLIETLELKYDYYWRDTRK